MKLCGGEVLGIFTKIGITFSYGIKIKNLLACWKVCYEGCVMIGSRFSSRFSTISSSYDLQKCTQASWYRLVQLSKIDTSSLMWSCFDLDWSSCMSKWFDPGGISLACKLILTESDD